MKIVPEPVTVLAHPEKGELMILMDGFRLTLTGDEVRALQTALAKGMSQLFPRQQMPAFDAVEAAASAAVSAGDAARAAEIRALVEAAKQKLERYDAASEPKRPLSA